MPATARRLACRIALPIMSAGIIAGAAVGSVGTAAASTHPAPQPGIVAAPNHIPVVTRFPSKRTERLQLQQRLYGH